MFLVTFGMTNTNMYYYTKVMQELFVDSQFPDTKNTFRGMTTMQDFWRVSSQLFVMPITPEIIMFGIHELNNGTCINVVVRFGWSLRCNMFYDEDVDQKSKCGGLFYIIQEIQSYPYLLFLLFSLPRDH